MEEIKRKFSLSSSLIGQILPFIIDDLESFFSSRIHYWYCHVIYWMIVFRKYEIRFERIFHRLASGSAPLKYFCSQNTHELSILDILLGYCQNHPQPRKKGICICGAIFCSSSLSGPLTQGKESWQSERLYTQSPCLPHLGSAAGIWDPRISCSNRAYLHLFLCLFSQG